MVRDILTQRRRDAEKGKAKEKAKGKLTRSCGERGDALSSAPFAPPREIIPDDEKPFDIPVNFWGGTLGRMKIY